MATGNAVAALSAVARRRSHASWSVRWRAGREAGAFELSSTRGYNPEAISPVQRRAGLIGVILTLTMVLITGLAITGSGARTMENLLSTRRPRSR